VDGISRAAKDQLASYPWPGNVRELQNVVAAMAVHAPPRGRVGCSAVPDTLDWGGSADRGATLEEARRRFEAQYVRLALGRAGGRRAEAARELGLTRQGLAKLLARLQMDEATPTALAGGAGPTESGSAGREGREFRGESAVVGSRC
jgi:DNA-binding NtrC family response regulator